jgi:hypothetical protein
MSAPGGATAADYRRDVIWVRFVKADGFEHLIPCVVERAGTIGLQLQNEPNPDCGVRLHSIDEMPGSESPRAFNQASGPKKEKRKNDSVITFSSLTERTSSSPARGGLLSDFPPSVFPT